ncbi:ABC transporter ATP-binding protein [Bacillota bacterium Meth-B3]
MIGKLLSYVREYRRVAALAPLAMVGEVLMEVLIPMLMAAMIDGGVRAGNVGYTVRMGLLMAALALASLGFGALSGRLAAQAGMGFAKNLREGLFGKVQDFSFKNADRFPSATLVTRLTTDVTNVQNTFMMLLRMAVRAPLMLVMATVMAVSINARLSMVFLAVMPILGGAMYYIMKNAYPRFGEMMKQYDRLNGRVQENLIAIRVVKAFVREDYERVRFEEEASAVRTAQVRAEKLVVLGMPLMQLCMYGCIVAVMWFGGNMIAAGTFAIGEMSGFISYIMQILMSLMMLSMVFLMAVLSRASVGRIAEVLSEPIDITDAGADRALVVADGSVEFDRVSFSYAGDEARLSLTDVSLSIAAGQTVGILGGTGSGKTTLTQLIPRLYDATRGTVRVGGRDVRDYPLGALRDAVAMVLQKNVLFSGTIRENLKWGNERAADDEIEWACRAAQAHDFIMSFPQGYGTELGQGGVNLSGGQKQRLCIARALLKKPKVLILDDSTSAVDVATDARIRRALADELTGATKIIIAQRVTSVMDADQIVVMDEGRVSAVGTHEELMDTSEIYREVYSSQQKGVA